VRDPKVRPTSHEALWADCGAGAYGEVYDWNDCGLGHRGGRGAGKVPTKRDMSDQMVRFYALHDSRRYTQFRNAGPLFFFFSSSYLTVVKSSTTSIARIR